MPRFKNISGVRVSLKIPGRKGLTFVGAEEEISISQAELAQLAEDKYVLDGYLALIQNQPKPKAIAEEPKEEPVAEAPKKSRRGKK